MEDTHGDQLLGDIQADTIIVLILIVMEDIHGDYRSRRLYTESCLNPYYNGRHSWSYVDTHIKKDLKVLILIIMEDTHGESRHISP